MVSSVRIPLVRTPWLTPPNSLVCSSTPSRTGVEFPRTIIGHPHPDFVLVQYFEWLMGEPNTIELVPISTIANGVTINGRKTDGTWQLYRSVDQMNAWYEAHQG